MGNDTNWRIREMDTELRHTLVQYHGGGYDGCFWEWNYFYIDHDGEFHDVASSGRAGCSTAEDAETMLAENRNHTYTYDITDPAAIAEFCRESVPPHVRDVLQWMNNNDVPFYTACAECGQVIKWAEDIVLEGWHGCGGIASTADTLLCTDCHSTGQCFICGEYVGQSGFGYERDTDDCSESVQYALNEWDEDNGLACQWCWEQERDSLIADEQADLLSASLATGTPDLFSDEMRWFWGV
jgi:hypothetical protein